MFKKIKFVKKTLSFTIPRVNGQPISYASEKSSGQNTNFTSWTKSEEEMKKHFNVIDWNFQDLQSSQKDFYKPKVDEYQARHYKSNKMEAGELSTFIENFNKTQTDYRDNSLNEANSENILELSKKFRDYKFNQDYLRGKSSNYLLISGFDSTVEIEKLITLCQTFGEIMSYNLVKDIKGTECLFEVYFKADKVAVSAKAGIDNYFFEGSSILKANLAKDYTEECINNRTVVVTPIAKKVKHNDLLAIFSQVGNVMSIDMPVEFNQAKLKEINEKLFGVEKLEDINNIANNHAENMIKSLEFNSEQSKIDFVNFYSISKKLLKDFQKLTKEKNENFEELNKMLVELKYFLEKLFPQNVINSIIYSTIQNEDVDFIKKLSSLSKEKVRVVYKNLEANLNLIVLN